MKVAPLWKALASRANITSELDVLKRFMSVYECLQWAKVLVPGRTFQPSLKIVGKDMSLA